MGFDLAFYAVASTGVFFIVMVVAWVWVSNKISYLKSEIEYIRKEKNHAQARVETLQRSIALTRREQKIDVDILKEKDEEIRLLKCAQKVERNWTWKV